MNSTTQLDFHPDAESLNAFAEQALPERERGQIVAHLAVCSRCRQVIFVAQQATAEMEMAAVPVAHSVRRSGPWLSGWRLAWIPAAALATVVGLVFLVHGRHEETGTEMARATPTAPLVEGNAAKPAATARVTARKSSAPVLSEAVKPAESIVESAPAVAASQPIPAMALPPQAAASESITIAPPMAEPPETETMAGSAGHVIGLKEYKPEPIPEALQTHRVGAFYSSNATAANAPRAKMDEMEKRAPASSKAEARYAGSGGGLTSQLKKEDLPHSNYDTGAQLPVIQFETAREASAAPLPSGLAAVSTVTARNRTLAIDQAGTLFLSKDSGSHWESVARQWTGRAVDVSLRQFLNGSSAAAAPSGSAAAASAAPAEVFELRNDKNQTWVSADGMTWTAR